MNLRSQRSQSTTEFLIVMAVIISAILLGAQNFLKPAILQLMNNIGDAIHQSTNRLKGI